MLTNYIALTSTEINFREHIADSRPSETSLLGIDRAKIN